MFTLITACGVDSPYGEVKALYATMGAVNKVIQLHCCWACPPPYTLPPSPQNTHTPVLILGQPPFEAWPESEGAGAVARSCPRDELGLGLRQQPRDQQDIVVQGLCREEGGSREAEAVHVGLFSVIWAVQSLSQRDLPLLLAVPPQETLERRAGFRGKEGRGGEGTENSSERE